MSHKIKPPMNSTEALRLTKNDEALITTSTYDLARATIFFTRWTVKLTAEINRRAEQTKGL